MQWQIALRWCALAALLLAIILIPFLVYEQAINEAVENFLESDKPTGVIALAVGGLLAADVILPVPSSLIATASGFLMGLPLGALATWLGMNAGAAIGYWLGATAGRGAVRRFVGDKELAHAAAAYKSWGDWSLIVSRAVPVLAEASVVFAGTVRMSRTRFALLTGLANAVIALVYAAVGAFALETRTFLVVFIGSIAIPGLAMWLTRNKSAA